MKWDSTEYLVRYHIACYLLGRRTWLLSDGEMEIVEQFKDRFAPGGYWLDTGRGRDYVGTCAVTGSKSDSLSRVSYLMPEDVNA